MREAIISSTRTKSVKERVEEIEALGLTVGIVTAYCVSFAKEFAKGSGLFDFTKASWPTTCIDWGRATAEFMQNFTEIDGSYFALG